MAISFMSEVTRESLNSTGYVKKEVPFDCPKHKDDVGRRVTYEPSFNQNEEKDRLRLFTNLQKKEKTGKSSSNSEISCLQLDEYRDIAGRSMAGGERSSSGSGTYVTCDAGSTDRCTAATTSPSSANEGGMGSFGGGDGRHPRDRGNDRDLPADACGSPSINEGDEDEEETEEQEADEEDLIGASGGVATRGVATRGVATRSMKQTVPGFEHGAPLTHPERFFGTLLSGDDLRGPATVHITLCLMFCLASLENDPESWPSTLDCMNCVILSSLLAHFSSCYKIMCQICLEVAVLIRYHHNDTCEHEICRRIKSIQLNQESRINGVRLFVAELKSYLSRKIPIGKDVAVENLQYYDKFPAFLLSRRCFRKYQRRCRSRDSSVAGAIEMSASQYNMALIPSENIAQLGEAFQRDRIINRSISRSHTGATTNNSAGVSCASPIQSTFGSLSPIRRRNRILPIQTANGSALPYQLTNGTVSQIPPPTRSLSHGDIPPISPTNSSNSTSKLTNRSSDTFSRSNSSNAFSLLVSRSVPADGRVTYAPREYMLAVVRSWLQNRPQGQDPTGVILSEYLQYLHVPSHRYSCNEDAQWVVLSPLGRGMFGEVYLAQDNSSGYKFSIKQERIEKFSFEEIRIWSGLKHPNIVALYGVLLRDEYILMPSQYVSGGTITQLIDFLRELKKRLSTATIRRYTRQLLQVLGFLKTKHIIHNDVKCDNVLIDDSGENIKLTDFGMAVEVSGDYVPAGRRPAGTETHLSPEKAASEAFDYGADVWAVGCIIYHMLEGFHPWRRTYPGASTLLLKIVQNDPPIDEIPSSTPHHLRDLLRHCWVRDPHMRQNAQELLSRPFHAEPDADIGPDTVIHSNVTESLPNAEGTSHLRPAEVATCGIVQMALSHGVAQESPHCGIQQVPHSCGAQQASRNVVELAPRGGIQQSHGGSIQQASRGIVKQAPPGVQWASCSIAQQAAQGMGQLATSDSATMVDGENGAVGSSFTIPHERQENMVVMQRDTVREPRIYTIANIRQSSKSNMARWVVPSFSDRGQVSNESCKMKCLSDDPNANSVTYLNKAENLLIKKDPSKHVPLLSISSDNDEKLEDLRNPMQPASYPEVNCSEANDPNTKDYTVYAAKMRCVLETIKEGPCSNLPNLVNILSDDTILPVGSNRLSDGIANTNLDHNLTDYMDEQRSADTIRSDDMFGDGLMSFNIVNNTNTQSTMVANDDDPLHSQLRPHLRLDFHREMPAHNNPIGSQTSQPVRDYMRPNFRSMSDSGLRHSASTTRITSNTSSATNSTGPTNIFDMQEELFQELRGQSYGNP